MTFGKKLRSARLAAGLSQGELADDRCSLSYISHLETGRRSPTPELVRYFEVRLGLPAGELGETTQMSHTQRRRIEEADLLATYCDAMDAWRAGMFAHAADRAEGVQAALPARGREDLRELVRILLVNINIDLGHYARATDEASAHWREAAASGSPSLETKAACLASRAARLSGDTNIALEAAVTALSLTAKPKTPLAARAEALRAAIPAMCACGHGAESAPYVAELSSIAEKLEPSHERGLCAWVVGNANFRMGNVADGIRWHREALKELSSSVDLRNWARFPRASVEERLLADTGEDVDELLEIAGQRVALLDSADELAALALVRAKLASSRGRKQEALAHLADALEELDLPTTTQGELYTLGAQVHGDLGHHLEAASMALKAARLFTDAGQSSRAQEAWRIVDAHSATA